MRCFISRPARLRLTVVSNDGKEATIGILGDGEFFGEGALASQVLRMGSATAMTDCAVLRIDRRAMMEATSSGTRIVRHVRGLFVGAEHPLRRGSG
jgi:CRP/FNR family transcriptional regulator, cyclic AMP receptor protein